MTEYHIQPPTRRCVATGRELLVGERYFTALVETGDHFQRQDFAAEAWNGPPTGAFSYWVGKIPATPEGIPAIEESLAAGININLYAGIGMFVVGAIFITWALTRPLGEELREAEPDERGGSATHAAPRGVDAAALASEESRGRVRGDEKGTCRPDDPGGQ